VRPIALERGQFIVFMVQFSKYGSKYWTRGTFCTSSLSRKGQKSTRFGKVTLTFSWHIQFWSDLWHYREDILEYYRPKFQTQKG
jgi:hypothetical protein